VSENFSQVSVPSRKSLLGIFQRTARRAHHHRSFKQIIKEQKDQRKHVEQALTTLAHQVRARCSEENSVPLTNGPHCARMTNTRVCANPPSRSWSQSRCRTAPTRGLPRLGARRNLITGIRGHGGGSGRGQDDPRAAGADAGT